MIIKIIIIIIIIVIIIIIIKNKTLFIDLKKKIDYLQILEYENIKIYTLCTFFLSTKENCCKMTI